MSSVANKSEVGRYAVAKKLFAILAEHSAEEIETTADIVRGSEALAEVLRRLAAVRRQDESRPNSAVVPVNGGQQAVDEAPAEPGDPWALKHPSYLTEEDMLNMLRKAMTDTAVPREELLKLPHMWGPKAPARRLENGRFENERGRPALVVALHTLFEKQFPSPRDRILYGFMTLYVLAKHAGRQDSVVRRLRHDVEARLADNLLTYSEVQKIAALRRAWDKTPLDHDPNDSRAHVAKNLVEDLLHHASSSYDNRDASYRMGQMGVPQIVEEQPLDRKLNQLLSLMHDAAYDAMDPMIARHRRDEAKRRHVDD